MKALLVEWTPDWPPECTGQRIIVHLGTTLLIDNDALGPTVAEYPLDFTPGLLKIDVKGFNETDYYEDVKHLEHQIPEQVSDMEGGLTLSEVDI